MAIRKDAKTNREYWDRDSDEYQARHGKVLSREPMSWGVWRIPEADIQVLGRVKGKDVLELGCGGAQWSVALAQAGARPVGLDNSKVQLSHAKTNMAAAGLEFPLVHSSAERISLPDQSFDLVFADHGAPSFADPRRLVPECARLLRPRGRLVFCMSTPFRDICWSDRSDRLTKTMQRSYFDLHRWEGDDHVEYQLPYGEWIRLFRENDFVVEDLVELRPPASARTSYAGYASVEWSRRWPAEHIWKTRKR
jgi:ubiquinone/menaquinone biosynthesis C-methylase UbiE